MTTTNEKTARPFEMVLDRARGALWGQATGDALGTTIEFRDMPAPKWPAFPAGPCTDIVGGGPFNVAKGQVTDDTQMAVVLARHLSALEGFDAEAVAKGYAAWRKVAFDIGGLTSGSLGEFVAGASARNSGMTYWRRTGSRQARNGSLMRTSPIGVAFFGADQAEDRMRASIDDSRITHADPRCVMACAAFNAAIAAGIRGGSKEDMLLAAKETVPAAATLLVTEYQGDYLAQELSNAQCDLLSDLNAADQDNPGLVGPLDICGASQGFVRVAFRLAFWALMHAKTFKQGIVGVASMGGDSDTTGAIAGALLGAFYGEQNIPEEWRTVCRNALADKPTSVWRTEYHPNHFDSLVP
jgi:ADP-ribosylglycohydrolase